MYSFTVEMSPLNLDKIQDWIDQGRLDPSQPITIKELSASRCLHGIKDGVKLLARGADILRSPIHILVSRASTAAIAAIEARGGSVTTRYYTRQSIKRVLAGEAENSWMPLPGKLSEEMGEVERKEERLVARVGEGMWRLPDPTSRRDLEYYRDEGKRGYLSHTVPEGHGPSLFFRTPGVRSAVGVEGKRRKKGKVTVANNLW